MAGSRKQPPPSRGQPRFRIRVWALRHLQVAVETLGRLARSPMSTGMTVAVIGIALALPTGLHVLLSNLQQLTGGWDGTASISLFLKESVDDDAAQTLAGQLRGRGDFDQVEVIGRGEALAEFRRLSGFGDALKALDENPLPAVLVISPSREHSTPEQAAALVAQLSRLPETDFAQLDMQWMLRIHAIMEIARRGILVLAGLFGLAVLLVVGNTIRLEIQNRHDEIEITKLIGATNAFIRRPFLYSGLWYGILGGVIAWLLVALSLWSLAGPVQRLSGLYHSQFALTGMNAETLLSLLIGSILLGLIGSWLSVSRHLSAIQPT